MLTELEKAKNCYNSAKIVGEKKEIDNLRDSILTKAQIGAPFVSFWAAYSKTVEWAKENGFTVDVTENSRKQSSAPHLVEVQIKISGWTDKADSTYTSEAKKDTTKEYASLIRVLEIWKATYGLESGLTPTEARDFILANSDAMVDTNGLTNTLKLFYENLGRKIDGSDLIASMEVYDRRNYYFLNSSSEGHKCSIT